MAEGLYTNPLLTAVEAGAMLHVDPSIVIIWSEAGTLRSFFTASGERHFLTVDILALFPEPTTEQPGPWAPDPAAASAVVAEAVVIAAEADAKLAQEAIDLAAADVLVAASRAAEAAERAREARAFAATLAAESVARTATSSADAHRARVEVAADRVRAAAAEAVQTRLDSDAASGTPDEVSRTAELIAEVVATTAEAVARESARAAAMTAEAAAEAAAQVALAVSALDDSIQAEVTTSAVDLAEAANAAAQRLALVRKQQVESIARLARQTAGAVEAQAMQGATRTTRWVAQTSFPAELMSPVRAREFVSAHLREHGLPHLVDDVRLVVSELATNAVLHGRAPMAVTLEQSGQLLTVAVEDGSSVVPSEPVGSVMDVEGRGLTIVRQLSREWGVTRRADGSKAVWASFLSVH